MTPIPQEGCELNKLVVWKPRPKPAAIIIIIITKCHVHLQISNDYKKLVFASGTGNIDFELNNIDNIPLID